MNSSLGQISAWNMLLLGGPIMIPILICSVFALATIIEKVIYFHTITTDLSKLKETIFDLIKKNKIQDAISLCDSHPSLTSKILKSGLIKFSASKEEIKQAMEEAGLFEIPKLENHLGVLSTIAHISPLLGLLGTAMGMFSCFHTIQLQSAALTPVTPGDFAGGIAQALISTIAGLLIAIITFIAYNYFINRVHYFVFEIEKAATELISFIHQITEN